MHDERKWPLSALLLRGRSTLARRVAERRRPGQRQHIEIELPGPVLPGILRERQSGGQHHGKDDGKRRTNEKQRTRPGHAITPSLNWTHQVSRISARPGTLQEQNSNQRGRGIDRYLLSHNSRAQDRFPGPSDLLLEHHSYR